MPVAEFNIDSQVGNNRSSKSRNNKSRSKSPMKKSPNSTFNKNHLPTQNSGVSRPIMDNRDYSPSNFDGDTMEENNRLPQN